MISFQTIIFAIIGGILPPLLWLFFWLREDRLHPEPKKYIVRSFVFGMAAVIVAIPLEYFSQSFFTKLGVVLFAWSFIEEAVKFLAAYFGGLHTKALDEPIDAVIYMVTAALGFAALENVFFLSNPEASASLLHGLVTTNIRFVGATLLHTITSGTIGVFAALSLRSEKGGRLLRIAAGMAIAVVLHALFNYHILANEGGSVLMLFSFVWLAVILFILAIEKIKRIRRKQNTVML